MHLFEETARRVIFEHEDAEHPYWGRGSSVLLATAKHYFWVTAEHVIKNQGGSPEALRVFPADGSKKSLPFNQLIAIKKEGGDDEDYKDICVFRIDISEFDATGDAPLVAQDVEAGIMPAELLSPGDELWVIGYPSDCNYIDTEARTINSIRSVIRGVYQGFSVSDHCHKARIETSISLSSFDGLSGSPVFHLKPLSMSQQDIQFPMLVGILLRGTVESSLVHFVSSRVVKELIALASLYD